MQLKAKEHTKESLLKKKLKQLEVQLLKTQKKLQQEADYNNHLEGIIKENSRENSTTITIRSAVKNEFVQVDAIVCCNADESYTYVQLIDGRTIIATKPLVVFERILEQYSFFKISKSHIINTNQIVTFHKDRNQILLLGNILLDISRRRRVEFLKLL